MTQKPTKGIAVDGWCSGNPGPGGYRGICLETGKVLFKNTYPWCTNNIVEFLAICHGLGYAKIHKSYNAIYSDSAIAIAWIDKRKSSSYMDTSQAIKAGTDIWRSENWLSEQKSLTQVIKWVTKEWGEIPADTGRKLNKQK